MDWTPARLDDYLQRPGQPHILYPSERSAWNSFVKYYRKMRRLAGIEA
jgi:hypothetical protein